MTQCCFLLLCLFRGMSQDQPRKIVVLPTTFLIDFQQIRQSDTILSRTLKILQFQNCFGVCPSLAQRNCRCTRYVPMFERERELVRHNRVCTQRWLFRDFSGGRWACEWYCYETWKCEMMKILALRARTVPRSVRTHMSNCNAHRWYLVQKCVPTFEYLYLAVLARHIRAACKVHQGDAPHPWCCEENIVFDSDIDSYPNPFFANTKSWRTVCDQDRTR